MENLRHASLPARMLEIRVTLSGAGYWIKFSHTNNQRAEALIFDTVFQNDCASNIPCVFK